MFSMRPSTVTFTLSNIVAAFRASMSATSCGVVTRIAPESATVWTMVSWMSPGTGDIQLTIVQTVALSGAILVTTPQEVALIDARKAATMFDKVNVTVLGLIENMSYFACPGDGKRYDIFGSGGGEREAKRLRVPLLGQIPIDIATRESGDRGMPITAESGDSPVAAEFMKIAARLREHLL